jgi:membrane protein YqaA with SNARE-associated domain
VLATLGIALGVAFCSAVVPVINIEIFLIAMATNEASAPWQWLALGAVVAAGQTAGKLLYYLAARESLEMPKFLRRKPTDDQPITQRRLRWRNRTERWRAMIDRITEKCHRHPAWMMGTYGVSSVIGIPPYMAVVVIAGLVRMSLLSFLSVGFLGRCLRFTVLAASPELVAAWLF